jgi:hypothetical protein
MRRRLQTQKDAFSSCARTSGGTITHHKNTESMKTKVCAVAQQLQQRGPAGPSLSEVLGSAAAIPEATPIKRNGGSIFNTLAGNVLKR